MNDFNQYTKQTQKLTNRQIWKPDEEYWYHDAAERYVQSVERFVAIDRGSGKPVLNLNTGKQLKKVHPDLLTSRVWISSALGRWDVIPDHWRPVPYRLPEVIAAIEGQENLFSSWRVRTRSRSCANGDWWPPATRVVLANGKLAHAEELPRRLVVIIPDNDAPVASTPTSSVGRWHA